MAAIGERIGPFEVVETLSRGARATLFRGVRVDGTDREPREVVLRVAHDPDDAETRAGLRAEYELLRHLDDRRVRRAYAYYAAQGAVALEMIHGPSLRAVTRLAAQGRLVLDPPTVLDIVLELAQGLRHVHLATSGDLPAVHGDLRAQTVRLDHDGRVVIVDFGPWRVHSPDDAWPPEVMAGLPADAASDRWMLGALAVELLTRAPLHPPGTAFEARARGDVDEALFRVERACAPMRPVLMRLLARDPTQRFDAEGALLRELHGAIREVGGRSRRAELPALARPTPAVSDAPPVPMGPLADMHRDAGDRSSRSAGRDRAGPDLSGMREEARPRVLFQAPAPLVEAIVEDTGLPSEALRYPTMRTGPSTRPRRPVAEEDPTELATAPALVAASPPPSRRAPAEWLPAAGLVALISLGVAILAWRLF